MAQAVPARMRKRTTYAERVFTKNDPCTKIHIFNCFHGPGSVRYEDGTVSSNIVRAKSYIGRHVPYRLRAAKRAELVLVDGEAHLRLTPEGVHWLWHGTKRYVKNNPSKAGDIEFMPRHWRRQHLKSVAK